MRPSPEDLPHDAAARRIDAYGVLSVLFKDDVSTTLLALRDDAGRASELVTLTRVNGTIARRPEVREAFLARASLAELVHHPCFLRPARAFVHYLDLYVEAEHAAGWRLSEVLELCRRHGQPLPLRIGLRIFLDVSEALLALASAVSAIAHGDVGPATIVVTTKGAGALAHSGMAVAELDGAADRRVRYKAPEVLARGGWAAPATPAADVWSFGVALREALTGVHPFAAATDAEAAALARRGASPSAAGPKLPAGVVAVIERAMQLEPAARYGTVEALHRDLAHAVAGLTAPHAEVGTFVELLQRRGAQALELARAPSEDLVAIGDTYDDEKTPAVGTDRPMWTSVGHEDATPAPRSTSSPTAAPTVAPTDAEDAREEPRPRRGREGSSLSVSAAIVGTIVMMGLAGFAIRSSAEPRAPASSAKPPAFLSAPPQRPVLDCKPGLADCNGVLGDACETKLDSDPKHCGSCARDCLGGACRAGACAPVVIASKQAQVSSVAVDVTNAYFATADAVVAAPLHGGATTVLASKVDTPADLVADGDALYWTSGAGAVMTVPKGGGSPRVLASKQSSPSSIVARDGVVYWTNTTPRGAVMRVAASGGTPEVVAANVDMPCGVTLIGDDVYFTAYGAGTVSKVPRAGGAPKVVASRQAFPCAIAGDDKALYWLDVGSPSAVMKLGPDGAPVKVASIAGNPAVALALDPERVYWTSANRRASIAAVAHAGGEPKALADATSAAGVAWANGVVVFADFGAGTVNALVLGENAPPQHDMAAMEHDHGAPAAVASASASTSAPPSAAGDVVELKIASVGNTMAFDKVELTVKTGQQVHLEFQNVATMAVLKHNWVLVKTGTEAKVAEAGLAAGEAASYVVAGDDVVASTKLASGGQTVDVTFTAPAPGTYPYVCTMPGHYVVMKGKLVVTP